MYQSIDVLEQQIKPYQIEFVNSLVGFKPLNLLGTKDKNGVENLAMVSTLTHLSSSPPLFGIVLRVHHTPRHSYLNIQEMAYFSLNAVSEKHISRAHQTSGHYGRDVSEFAACGLEAEYSDHFSAPYVSGSPIRLGMKYIDEYRIPGAKVVMLVGELTEYWVDTGLVKSNGSIQLDQAEVVAGSGCSSYYRPVFLERREIIQTKQVME